MRGLFIFSLLSASMCGAQITGRFTIDKAAFAPGEPVVLNFTIHNDGKTPVYISTADPYSFCSGYKIQVDRTSSPDAACPPRSYGGSCASGLLELAPGASRTEQILLNYQNLSRGERKPVVRLPGDYTIDAARDVAFEADSSFKPPYRTLSFKQTLYLRVDPDLKVPAEAFVPSIAQLRSTDFTTNRNAALTLATLAPAELEPLLLTFATSKEPAIHENAPDALANLNTEASLAALAAMAQNEQAGSYASMRSAELLGETHDSKWFPLLLSTADKNAGISTYLQYAADSGGDAAVAPLAGRLRTADASTRMGILYALGETGSAAAVPILIGSLPSGPSAQSADSRSLTWQTDRMLQQLTHYTASTNYADDDVSTWRPRWQRWWLGHGSTAKTYFSEACGSAEMLP
ncbi:HEAT repeat domain-containing protein [Terriglobus sp.]|uniref:HEAT repeat domain-containing protein n=1 Tax=Terriglobus sp. TaxID=1889013 RepID=UPI003B00AC0A